MTYETEKQHDRNHAVSRKQYTVLLDRPSWGAFLRLLGQILDPGAFAEHGGTDGAFEKIRSLADGKQRDDANAGEPA